MRKFCWLYCALLSACGPDAAPESASTGATSTGATSTGATSTDAGSTGQPTTPTTDGTSEDETGGTSSTTDLTTTGATTGEATDSGTTGAACVQIDHGGDPRQWPEQFELTCGLDPLCPVPARVQIEPQNGGWTTNDIDGARCIAAALRDRTPGQLEYESLTTIYSIEVLGEQVILRQQYEGLGFGYVFFERATFLQPPEFFADCAVGTAAQIQKCLAFGDTEQCAETLLCPS